MIFMNRAVSTISIPNHRKKAKTIERNGAYHISVSSEKSQDTILFANPIYARESGAISIPYIEVRIKICMAPRKAMNTIAIDRALWRIVSVSDIDFLYLLAVCASFIRARSLVSGAEAG